ncbi:MAG: hypothetical protein GXO12_02620 [Epsilonproteobacteria bacterium]|nr:hypothetical protein [Campylobacterota bacterium]
MTSSTFEELEKRCKKLNQKMYLKVFISVGTAVILIFASLLYLKKDDKTSIGFKQVSKKSVPVFNKKEKPIIKKKFTKIDDSDKTDNKTKEKVVVKHEKKSEIKKEIAKKDYIMTPVLVRPTVILDKKSFKFQDRDKKLSKKSK